MALGEEIVLVTSYRLGHRCRWLLPGDILHFIHNPNPRRLEPSFFHFRAPPIKPTTSSTPEIPCRHWERFSLCYRTFAVTISPMFGVGGWVSSPPVVKRQIRC